MALVSEFVELACNAQSVTHWQGYSVSCLRIWPLPLQAWHSMRRSWKEEEARKWLRKGHEAGEVDWGWEMSGNHERDVMTLGPWWGSREDVCIKAVLSGIPDSIDHDCWPLPHDGQYSTSFIK